MERTDRRKASAMTDGNFVEETRMTLGHRATPQTAQGLLFVIARFLLEEFDEEFPRVLKEMSASTQRVIAAWIK